MIVEGIVYHYRCGIAWCDVPAVFGPWQTLWTWHRRVASQGTWDRVLERLLAAAEAAGRIDWSVSVDSTIARAHQHATNATRLTGGWVELHESASRATLSRDKTEAMTTSRHLNMASLEAPIHRIQTTK